MASSGPPGRCTAHPVTVGEFKEYIGSKRGIVLDIDETLSWTAGKWLKEAFEKFGNPEGLTERQFFEKYHLVQNAPKDLYPRWHAKDVVDWMNFMRMSPEMQLGIELVEGAKEGVAALHEHTSIVGYMTARPQCMNRGTYKWLRSHGFPDVPVMAKPDEVPFQEGNRWKAQALKFLEANVTAIVDDNPKVALFCDETGYAGPVFQIGQTCASGAHGIACATWSDVVREVKQWAKGAQKKI